MSGVEVVGVILGALPLLVSTISAYGDGVSLTAPRSAKYQWRILQYGRATTWILYSFFFDAFAIMDRVESHIRDADEKQVIAFIHSQTSSFNMIGIAGAIIAQVAISAMSLTNFTDSHWTAHAFFIVSLVTGSLSVFFSCAVSLLINGLHSSDDIKDFVFLPSTSRTGYIMEKMIQRRKQGKKFDPAEISKLVTLLDGDTRSVASPYAATMIVVPRSLLNIALNAFLMGLGVYLGKLYTAKLVPAYGSGSIGILTFYLVSAVCGIAMYYIPQSLHSLETTKVQLWHELLERYAKEEMDAATSEPEVDNPTHATHVPQSRHVRDGKRIHFAIDDAKDSTPDIELHRTAGNLHPQHPSGSVYSLDVIEELMRPKPSTMQQDSAPLVEPNSTASLPNTTENPNDNAPELNNPPYSHADEDSHPPCQIQSSPSIPTTAHHETAHGKTNFPPWSTSATKDVEIPSDTIVSCSPLEIPSPLSATLHDMPDILRDMIRVQEESARLNRRLLDALNRATKE
ncbi:hypothetical protein J1614_004381 [Plenodomus biglobosus]|nr:hypothetical protein J1614_004381 [Plenodomus biglobosus]